VQTNFSNAQITNAELEFVRSDVFTFKPSDSSFDLILCLGLIAHVGRLDILSPHLKSMLPPAGRIILQTTLTDHIGARIVRAVTAQRELARRGYRISWFSQRDIADACHGAGLRIVEMRRHSLGIPFGDRLGPERTFSWKPSCKSGRAGMEQMRFTCSHQIAGSRKWQMSADHLIHSKSAVEISAQAIKFNHVC
jgi:hypothetical protein